MYGALAIVRPETVIRWHRGGFRSYWRWKSKHRCGRPAVTVEIPQYLIRDRDGAYGAGKRWCRRDGSCIGQRTRKPAPTRSSRSITQRAVPSIEAVPLMVG